VHGAAVTTATRALTLGVSALTSPGGLLHISSCSREQEKKGDERKEKDRQDEDTNTISVHILADMTRVELGLCTAETLRAEAYVQGGGEYMRAKRCFGRAGKALARLRISLDDGDGNGDDGDDDVSGIRVDIAKKQRGVKAGQCRNRASAKEAMSRDKKLYKEMFKLLAESGVEM
jgi:hypothetical protein